MFAQKYTLAFVVLLLSVLLLYFVSGCRQSEKKLLKKLNEKTIKPKLKTYKLGKKTVRYAETGTCEQALVVFVHGAPGSLDAYLDYLTDSSLVEKARVVSVDRPGYGGSDFGESVVSIKQQAALLKPILETKTGNNPTILVGHSFGGPIVARMAMDYPDLVDAIIMLAPAIDPENEKILWISYPADWKIFKWLVPKKWRVTNDEKLHHVSTLTNMLPLWEKLSLPVTHVHGSKDIIVPYVNTDFSERMITNAPLTMVRLPDVNHFLPWSHKSLVLEHIDQYLNE